jgi:hypothetical protein
LVGSGIGYGTNVGMVVACRDRGLGMGGWDGNGVTPVLDGLPSRVRVRPPDGVRFDPLVSTDPRQFRWGFSFSQTQGTQCSIDK